MMETGNLHWTAEGAWLIPRLHNQPGRECSPLPFPNELQPSILPERKCGHSRRPVVWFTELSTGEGLMIRHALNLWPSFQNLRMPECYKACSQGSRCGTRAGEHTGSLGGAVRCGASAGDLKFAISQQPATSTPSLGVAWCFLILGGTSVTRAALQF